MANAEIALVAFHTTFNLIGMIIVLPFTKQFAHLIERLIPDNTPQLTDALDPSLLQESALAMNALQMAIENEFHQLLQHIEILFNHKASPGAEPIGLTAMQQMLDQTHDYLDLIHLNREQSEEWPRLVALIHTLDHLQRPHERCDERNHGALDNGITVAMRPTFEWHF